MRKLSRFFAWLDAKGMLEIVPIVALFNVALAGWIFLEVSDEVIEGEADAFDRSVLGWLHSRPIPDWLTDAARDITALGSAPVLALLVIVAILFLALTKQWGQALFILIATTLGVVISQLLKFLFARPRPDLVNHEWHVYTASFPSGHAMMSAVVYLTLGTLIASLVETRFQKLFVVFVACGTAGLVGISRLYLGVHWPSDVVAGWAAGAGWAIACWIVHGLRIPHRRGANASTRQFGE